jgi:hypothetical protein
MITYTEITTYTGSKVIQADLDNGHTLYIPSDPANSDYQAYLKSLDEAATL